MLLITLPRWRHRLLLDDLESDVVVRVGARVNASVRMDLSLEASCVDLHRGRQAGRDIA